MLSVYCLHDNCSLCELWPLCDCDCHPEKRMEGAILRGQLDLLNVYTRMIKRQYWARPEVKERYREQRRTPPCKVVTRKRAQCSYPGCTATYLVRPDRNLTRSCKAHAALVRRKKAA